MEGNSVEVWIASVCSNSLAVNFLREAVLSALIQKLNPIIRISIYCCEDLDPIYNLIKDHKDRIFIYKQDKMLSQFDNLEFLLLNSKLSNEDWVIFLDDDDIMLENMSDKLSKEINGFVGYQYVGVTLDDKIIADNETVTLKNVKRFISDNKDILEADDFSGTALRFQYIQEYFKNHRCSKITQMLEDTNFMKFIEEKVPKIGNYRNLEPFIFHRIKTNSIWREQLTRILDKIIP